jgi:steroid delta-isomerase-like uncharacterized protein
VTDHRLTRRQTLTGAATLGAAGALSAFHTSTPARAAGEPGNAAAAVIAQRWCDAWNSHDVEQVLTVFTDDILYEDVTFKLVNHGHADLRKFAAFFFQAVPDLYLECLRAVLSDGQGSIEWAFSGTDHGVFKTGKRFFVRGASVITVRGNKISRNLDYYDAAKIMRDVGLLKSSR